MLSLCCLKTLYGVILLSWHFEQRTSWNTEWARDIISIESVSWGEIMSCEYV